MRAMSLWVILLETAIHTPSPHNVQPWRVRVNNDNEAELLIDSARTLPKEDPTGSFIILTMGMFVEALSLLAANHQNRLEYDLVHELEWYSESILEHNTQALFQDLNARDYHDEITSWFRFTDRMSLRHRDGLDYRCMNTSRLTYWLTARFPRMLLWSGSRSLLAKQYRRQIGP